MKWPEQFLAPAGSGVGVVAALCCAGSSALIGVLGAVGAGFLVNDLILLPLLALALAAAIWGLVRGRSGHGRPSPLWFGLGGSVALVAGIFAGVWIVWVGSAVLAGATVWNAVLVRA